MNSVTNKNTRINRHQFFGRVSLFLLLCSALLLPACSTPPQGGLSGLSMASQSPTAPKTGLWTPVQWQDLPGWNNDNLEGVWSAWLRSCQAKSSASNTICPQMRIMSLGTPEDKRQWMQTHFTPYAIENNGNNPTGLMTAYYEPFFEASLTKTDQFSTPLYARPADLKKSDRWYSRQEIANNPQLQEDLVSKAVAFIKSPIDALILQIQGSGRLFVKASDGSLSWYRLSFAGTNNQPYTSMGTWLIRRGVKVAGWPDIQKWYDNHPDEQQALLNVNPRVVFFKLTALNDLTSNEGPIGAQGIPLTPERSVAVDPKNIPLGTALWMSTPGPTVKVNKLVIAQDTGSAITGAVRIDYFTGWGPDAGELAGRVKQAVRLWAIWPNLTANTTPTYPIPALSPASPPMSQP